MNLSARQYFIFILFFDCLQVFLLRKNIFRLAHLHLLFKFMSGENVTVMEKRLFSNHKIAAWKHIVIFSHLYAVYIDTKKKEKRIWNPFEKWYESKTTTTIRRHTLDELLHEQICNFFFIVSSMCMHCMHICFICERECNKNVNWWWSYFFYALVLKFALSSNHFTF